MTKQLSPLRRKDIETGRKLERTAIVKWLYEVHGETNARFYAEQIKSQEHLR